ncbi:hypothetical protein Dda_7024 [Drechslerella dactyloides]|uniref:Uncharacterized protein n=1 Tax=Drechslerella dactyloides TaxID=74499 RepID=A0AAD6IU74_DREDA|nr:hypothetical protein Dda_7024 [Drechslerella dactyloides]
MSPDPGPSKIQWETPKAGEFNLNQPPSFSVGHVSRFKASGLGYLHWDISLSHERGHVSAHWVLT